MKIERKNMPVASLSSDDSTGTIKAIVAVTNNIDLGKDRILPGFFAKSLERKFPKGVWAHDWKQPVAKTIIAKELAPGDNMLPPNIKEFGGYYIEGQFNLETQRGKEAYSDIKFGIIDEFSIGYSVEKSERKEGVRDLIEGDWLEWSPVLAGMNTETSLISIKDAAAEDAEIKDTLSASYQDDLPDSAFALVEFGGKKDSDGKTTPRNLRHFPYKDKNGDADKTSVRNALARIPQSSLGNTQKSKALRVIKRAAKKVDVNVADDSSKSDPYFDVKGFFEQVLADRVLSPYEIASCFYQALGEIDEYSDAAETMGQTVDTAALVRESADEAGNRLFLFGQDYFADDDDSLYGYSYMGISPSLSNRAALIALKDALQRSATYKDHSEAVLAVVKELTAQSELALEIIAGHNDRRTKISEKRSTKVGRTHSADTLSTYKTHYDSLAAAKGKIELVMDSLDSMMDPEDEGDDCDPENPGEPCYDESSRKEAHQLYLSHLHSLVQAHAAGTK